MKLFKNIFWVTLGVLVIIVIADLSGLTTKGIDFQTIDENKRFISNILFWNAVAKYTAIIALVNLIFGGILFLTRGIRNQSSRRKDILIGIVLVMLPIIAGLYYLILVNIQSI